MFGQSSLDNGIIGDYLLLKAGKAMPADRISSSKADGMFPCFGGNGIRGYVDSYNYDGDYAIIGRQGALCGNVCLAQGKFYATEHAVVVTPKAIVDSTWLFFALNQMNLNQYARGVAQPGLAVNELEKLPFSVPDINKQIEFSIIAKQADKSKFSCLKSQFIEMFGDPVTNSKGWPTKPLSEVAPESPSRHQIEGIVWNLNLDMIESNSGKVISKIYEEVNRLLSVSQFDQGNVLFSKLRPYLNKVVVPDEIGYATTELVPLRPDQELLNKYFLAHLLRGHHFVSYANAIATGTKMPRMPMNSLRSFKCILPPMELQQQFVDIAEQADKSKFELKKSIEAIDKVIKSLINNI